MTLPKVFAAEVYSEIYARAALLANLEGIGDGEAQATLAELQALGTELLDLLDEAL